MTGYYCKECGSGVRITPEGPVRSCNHTGAIIASCEAVCYGEGGAAGSVTGVARLKAEFLRLWCKLFGG
jgi:hypothetical protein